MILGLCACLTMLVTIVRTGNSIEQSKTFWDWLRAWSILWTPWIAFIASSGWNIH